MKKPLFVLGEFSVNAFMRKGNDGDSGGSNIPSPRFSAGLFGCTEHGKSEKVRVLKTSAFRCLEMFGVGVISVAVWVSKLAFGGGVLRAPSETTPKL